MSAGAVTGDWDQGWAFAFPAIFHGDNAESEESALRSSLCFVMHANELSASVCCVSMAALCVSQLYAAEVHGCGLTVLLITFVVHSINDWNLVGRDIAWRRRKCTEGLLMLYELCLYSSLTVLKRPRSDQSASLGTEDARASSKQFLTCVASVIIIFVFIFKPNFRSRIATIANI